jgi:predicted DNA-binding protein (MmcQ/YjbR family)
VSSERKAVLAACERQQGAELSHPFGPQTAVFKIAGKIFAIVGLEHTPAQVTLKCDPSTARCCAPSMQPSTRATT